MTNEELCNDLSEMMHNYDRKFHKECRTNKESLLLKITESLLKAKTETEFIQIKQQALFAHWCITKLFN